MHSRAASQEAISQASSVVVSLPGDYGKPRPALVVQSDLFAERSTRSARDIGLAIITCTPALQ